MTAGLRNQRVAGTKVALAPAAIAGLLAAALLTGGLVGVGAKAGFDSITGSRAIGQAAATMATSPSLFQRQAQTAVGRGPLARDPGSSGGLTQPTTRALDHVGLTERLFPVSAPHRIEHGPLP